MPLEAKNERDKLNYCMEHPDAISMLDYQVYSSTVEEAIYIL